MKYIDADRLKAEIERLKIDYLNRSYTFVPKAMQDLLEFLDTLEEPVSDDLEEEIVKVCDDFVFPLYGLDDEFGRELINKIARHFAKWGAEHAKKDETPVSEDLEEAKEAYCNEHNDDCFDATGDNCPHIRKAFLAGAEWQKEQMLKEAVEGEVVKDINNKLAVTAKNVNLDGFRFGDKVRIIILPKEDKK